MRKTKPKHTAPDDGVAPATPELSGIAAIKDAMGIAPMPAVCVFYNRHRDTRIRIKIGNVKTAYIAMVAEGITVQWESTENFDAEWFPYPGYEVQRAAKIYLDSEAAQFYISEEARALLTEILSNSTGTIKELGNMAKKTAATKTKSKAAPAAKATAKLAEPTGKKAATGTPRAESKTGKLLAELQKGKPISLAALSDASGYDEQNARTCIGILRSKKGVNVVFNKETKLYTIGK